MIVPLEDNMINSRIKIALVPAMVFSLLLRAGQITAATAENNANIPILTVKTDRPEAVYMRGEPATFVITVMCGNQPATNGKVTVNFTLDLNKKISNQTLPLGAQPATAAQTLAEPGFLNCAVTYQGEDKSHVATVAAGFEPERIKTASILPADFDEFWAAGRAELAAIPMDAQLVTLPDQSNDQQESFKISFANVDNTRIYGYLSVPKNRKPPFPAIVTIPSAGIGKPREPQSTWAARGALSLTVGVHPCDVGLSAAQYKELAAGPLQNYFMIGAPDRKKYYYRRAILGVDRAVSYLAARSDFDGKHLVMDGSSQGGGFALIIAGFNDKVTAAAASVPAMCDHAGYLADRAAGWPGLVQNAPADRREEFLRMSAYFDVVNFTRKIKCPVIVGVGFIDSTCSPSSVYAAFNAIKSPKRIINGPLTGHGASAEYGQFNFPWLMGQLGLGKPI